MKQKASSLVLTWQQMCFSAYEGCQQLHELNWAFFTLLLRVIMRTITWPINFFLILSPFLYRTRLFRYFFRFRHFYDVLNAAINFVYFAWKEAWIEEFATNLQTISQDFSLTKQKISHLFDVKRLNFKEISQKMCRKWKYKPSRCVIQIKDSVRKMRLFPCMRFIFHLVARIFYGFWENSRAFKNIIR